MKQQDNTSLRGAVLRRIKQYGRTAGQLGERVRQQVFGARFEARRGRVGGSLLDKVHRHRLHQRQRAFQQAGGPNSSMALHALKKARHTRHRS